MSDGLDDGRIVSGVGGQYNFVAQAFALEGARSAIMLRASRTANGKTESNIRWSYGHTTIPHHLRDVIVTEYGIADLRGKTDRDVIAAMLAIADSRFQDELLRQARDAGKIERSFELAKTARDNTPDAVERALKPATRRRPADAVSVRQRFHRGRAAPAAGAGDAEVGVTGPTVGVAVARSSRHATRLRNCWSVWAWPTPEPRSEWLYAALVRGALDQGPPSAR